MGVLHRMRELLRSHDDIVSETLQRDAAGTDADAVAACGDRQRVRLHGTISVLTVHPRGETPWLEADLSDGTGSVTLVWMGRREIPGIQAGRRLAVEGRLSVDGDRRRMFNPRYELR